MERFVLLLAFLMYAVATAPSLADPAPVIISLDEDSPDYRIPADRVLLVESYYVTRNEMDVAIYSPDTGTNTVTFYEGPDDARGMRSFCTPIKIPSESVLAKVGDAKGRLVLFCQLVEPAVLSSRLAEAVRDVHEMGQPETLANRPNTRPAPERAGARFAPDALMTATRVSVPSSPPPESGARHESVGQSAGQHGTGDAMPEPRPAKEGATFIGPHRPYAQFQDSPFATAYYEDQFSYFYFEDFEDGRNDSPGVTIKGGSPIQSPRTVDSVDGDDGVLDGDGKQGFSWGCVNDVEQVVEVTFSKAALGSLPTHVGLVVTDGYGWTFVEAFDEQGESLGSIGPTVFLSPPNNFQGETDEDSFVGVVFSGGVARFRVEQEQKFLELDHLQFGFVGPSEPTAAPTLLFPAPVSVSNPDSASELEEPETAASPEPTLPDPRPAEIESQLKPHERDLLEIFLDREKERSLKNPSE